MYGEAENQSQGHYSIPHYHNTSLYHRSTQNSIIPLLPICTVLPETLSIVGLTTMNLDPRHTASTVEK